MLFLVDISESMRGKPLEDTKNALVAALLKLDKGDSFNVIAFNDEIHLFSSSLELATEKNLEKVTAWLSENLVAQGGTNMLLPMNQVLFCFQLIIELYAYWLPFCFLLPLTYTDIISKF